MSARSRGARAVVTGAGSGIGAAFAHELARRGGRVVCADIDPVRAEETAAAIRATGAKALALTCDVAELEQVEKLSAGAAEWFGAPATLVVNNAGVGTGGQPVGELPIEDWRWALGVNLWGVVHGCHVFAPALRAQGCGGIVNVASAAGFAAAPLMGAYNTGKAAVMSLSETMAAELSGTGVGVTVLCPTFVQTNVARDGRIASPSADLAATLMDWTGMSAQAVARQTLDAHDRGRLYVVPQLHARLIWHLKRHAPVPYTRVLGIALRIADALTPGGTDGSRPRPDPRPDQGPPVGAR